MSAADRRRKEHLRHFLEVLRHHWWWVAILFAFPQPLCVFACALSCCYLRCLKHFKHIFCLFSSCQAFGRFLLLKSDSVVCSCEGKSVQLHTTTISSLELLIACYNADLCLCTCTCAFPASGECERLKISQDALVRHHRFQRAISC